MDLGGVIILSIWYFVGVLASVLAEYYRYHEKPNYELTLGDVLFSGILSTFGPILLVLVTIGNNNVVLFKKKKEE